MLNVNDLSAHYGEVEVLHHVSLNAPKGEITVLVGANASGKSTLVSCVSGIHRGFTGQINFDGADIAKMRSDEIVELGIIQVPEGRLLFPRLTVRENLELGSYSKRSRARRKEKLDYVYALFPRLEERQNQYAGSLSGGEAQMCAIGRGLMGDPKLLILDEPSLGLAPLIVQDIMAIIKRVSEEGMTVLLVEQNVRQSLLISQHAYILENGLVKIEGSAKDLRESEEIRKAYLGI